jgi:hypothetical protein
MLAEVPAAQLYDLIQTKSLISGGRLKVELCAIRVAFVPLETSAPKFFGFSEFLAGLALMVLAWTIADVRYRFRIRSAPIPLPALTFSMVATVGVLTLLTDLCRAQGWLVPKVSFFTPASWQAILAGLYFLTFLVWVLFAFIKPAIFSKRNARNYAQTLFGVIVKGSPTELAVVADELGRSAKAIVTYATNSRGLPRPLPNSPRRMRKQSKTEAYANDILSLIADKRFCRAVIESSPGTAWAFFSAMAESKKYGIQIQTFAENIVNEAIENTGSFLYHETAGYQSGLIGNYKPICQAIFANYDMVETIGTVLNIDYRSRRKWDSGQWKAYCRAVLMTFRDYVEKGNDEYSYSLYGALTIIQDASSDLYKLNGTANSYWDNDSLAQLRVVVDFTKEAVEILEKIAFPVDLKKRSKGKVPEPAENIYDRIANLIYELILDASAVSSPSDLCWWVQNNALWRELFNFGHLNGQAGSLVKAKVCRLLYEDVLDMNHPNFKGARILGFCLNVMGLQRGKEDYYKDSRALHKAILIWTRRNFARLHDCDLRVAEACLMDGITYDAANHRIVRTYLRLPGQREAPCVYLNVDPQPQPITVGQAGRTMTPNDESGSSQRPAGRPRSRF